MTVLNAVVIFRFSIYEYVHTVKKQASITKICKIIKVRTYICTYRTVPYTCIIVNNMKILSKIELITNIYVCIYFYSVVTVHPQCPGRRESRFSCVLDTGESRISGVLETRESRMCPGHRGVIFGRSLFFKL